MSGRGSYVVIDHQVDQLLEGDTAFPAECLFGFQGVAQQFVRVGRAFETLVDVDVVLPVEADVSERGFQQVFDRVRLPCGQP